MAGLAGLAGTFAVSAALVFTGILLLQKRTQLRLKHWIKKAISIGIFAEVSVFLFTTIIYIKMLTSMNNDMIMAKFISDNMRKVTAYLPVVYGGLLCAGGIIWAVSKHMRTRPENLDSVTANIVFKNLSFEKCCCIIENTSETALYSVSVGWLCKTQHSTVQIHKCGTVPSKSELFITYHDWKHTTEQLTDADFTDVFLPVIPDTLQINYRMPNGNLVVHIITEASRKIDKYSSLNFEGFCTGYTEQVLLQRNGVYEKVIRRICRSQNHTILPVV